MGRKGEVCRNKRECDVRKGHAMPQMGCDKNRERNGSSNKEVAAAAAVAVDAAFAAACVPFVECARSEVFGHSVPDPIERESECDSSGERNCHIIV
jgi:hypothetical protein